MKMVLMQQPFVCADIAKNLANIKQACARAQQENASLLLTPSFALTGWPLWDILQHDFLFQAIDEAIAALFQVKNLAIFLSYPIREEGKSYLCQAVIHNGCFLKQQYIPFKADGNLAAATAETIQFSVDGVNFAVFFTESEPDSTVLADVDIVLLMAHDEFYEGITSHKLHHAKGLVDVSGKPVLVINPLGANDQYLYEGGSFALDIEGGNCFQAGYFEARDYVLEWQDTLGLIGIKAALPQHRIELLYRAIVFSLQEYLRQNNFKKICLGLSGGIDSALVLALSYEAIGAENCEVLLMPSQYTSNLSNDLAIQMVEKLGVAYSIVPVTDIFQQYREALSERFDGLAEDTTEENLQARIRGVLLMALSNKTGAILLCTGNKSEEAVGYCTLYGDTNGGFAPIKDLYKTDVYAMARWINDFYQDEIIPLGIINRIPTAELKPNQSDQDSLPEYAILDEIVELILQNKSATDIINQGYAEEIVFNVMNLMRKSEFKRQQGVLGPKISLRSFGREWNYPIVRLSKPF